MSSFFIWRKESEMNPRQTQVLKALRKGYSISEACKAANIGEDTFFKYLDHTGFQKEIELYTKRRNIQLQIDNIQSKLKAQSTLLSIIENDDTSAQDKIEASKLML